LPSFDHQVLPVLTGGLYLGSQVSCSKKESRTEFVLGHTMKTYLTIVGAIILAGVSSAAAADFYNQDFDSMGIGGLNAPTGWSMWYIAGGGSSSAIPTSAEMAAANPGVPQLQLWNQTDGPDAWSQQGANMGANPTSPNRLLGTSPTGTRGSVLQLSLNNNTGTTITSLRLTYDMQSMTALQTPDELPGYRLYYEDGGTWTHLTSLDLSSDGTASSMIFYANPVANGGTLQFRWFDDNAASPSPDTMIAIDNVNIVPEPTTLSLLALGALALISHRRKA
jgi:hypothetical protein